MTEPLPPAEPSAGQTVVIMPTYNERQNLESITGRVKAALQVTVDDALDRRRSRIDRSGQPLHVGGRD